MISFLASIVDTYVNPGSFVGATLLGNATLTRGVVSLVREQCVVNDVGGLVLPGLFYAHRFVLTFTVNLTRCGALTALRGNYAIVFHNNTYVF